MDILFIYICYGPRDSILSFPHLYSLRFQLSAQFDDESLVFNSDNVTWFRPSTLQQLLELKSTYPDAKLIGGNYEQGST